MDSESEGIIINQKVSTNPDGSIRVSNTTKDGDSSYDVHRSPGGGTYTQRPLSNELSNTKLPQVEDAK